MNLERDKFLTEAMFKSKHPHSICTCKSNVHNSCNLHDITVDFATWEGFGELWEWAQTQKWWQHFLIWTAFTQQYVDAQQRWVWYFVNPDRFATSVCQYLKDRA